MGGKFSLSKAERRKERKDVRKMIARQEHDKKQKQKENELKEQTKNEPRKHKAWKRRDKEGSIILWNYIKITKSSYIILGIMAAIIVLFAISPFLEDPNYVDPARLSFAQCESIDFEDVYCIYDFKFCREYADGSRICEYAETDPFVNLPALGNKYTPEEQDFLPPSGFIFPFAFATHEKYLGVPIEHFDDTTPKQDKEQEKYPDILLDDSKITEYTAILEKPIPESKDDIILYFSELKSNINSIELKMTEIELKLSTWEYDELNLINDKEDAEDEYEEAKFDFESAKTKYRHAQDLKVRTDTDIQIQKQAFDDYRTQDRLFEAAKKDLLTAQNTFDTAYDEHFEQKIKLQDYEVEWKDMTQKLKDAKIKLSLINREYQFINIKLSKTCEMLIKNQLPTKCPTYREMVPEFDNTLPKISGEFLELGYDIRRLPSPLTNHWELYKQLTKTNVVSVDPDSSLHSRGINITITAKDFLVLEKTGSIDKSSSFDSETLEQTVWKNIYVSKQCDRVTVGPDMDTIKDVILHVLNKCSTDLSEYKIIKQFKVTPWDKNDSEAWKQLEWFKNIAASLRNDNVR